MIRSNDSFRRQQIEPVPVELVAMITGRTRSLFDLDIAANRERVSAIVRHSRFLVVGAAGSIGAAFVRLLSEFEPLSLALTDINENALADLVRDLRSGQWRLPHSFTTSVVALGTTAFDRFLDERGPFDFVLNFAALKHVRSERDPYSLMRMIETNVFAVERLRQSLFGRAERLFSVSSDKAVSPFSLMGATKRWMELVLAVSEAAPICTSARFANVAFSNGSLPHAFLERLRRRQPIAAPNDVRRYFISHREGAQLCILAALLGEKREIFVPRLDPEHNAVGLDEVARRVLAFYNLAPAQCASADEALRHPMLSEATPSAWPCYFSPSNTTGEKDIEDLTHPHDVRDENRFGAITIVTQTSADIAALEAARSMVVAASQEKLWRKEALVAAIRRAVPQLRHHEQHRSLDDKI